MGVHYITLYVTNQYGCLDSITYSIEIFPDFKLYVPNAFTPNFDHLNDVFIPVGVPEGVYEYTMTIWNRWGELIFESNDLAIGWDGTLHGQVVQHGAYVYHIEVRDFIGVPHYMTGTVINVK